MAEHATTFTPAELSASVIVRPVEGAERYTYIPSRGEWQHDETGRWATFPCPYEVGDVLFHQEEWELFVHPPTGATAPAWKSVNGPDPRLKNVVWRPADTMPYWASRHRRTVTSVELVDGSWVVGVEGEKNAR